MTLVRKWCFLLLLLISVSRLHSQENLDSALSCISIRHSVKADLIPLYSVFFDARKQMRAALEYQVENGRKLFWGVHVDAGYYDDYQYYKYYDFFNQSTGLYYTRQDVKAYGFHVLPAWHYRLSRCGSRKRIQCLTGITADINMFEKRIRNFNSRTFERSAYKYRQMRLGAGVHIAATCRLSPSFSIELKSILIARLYMAQSQSGMKDIKPYKALWFDERQTVWLIPQLSMCYDF